MGLVKPNGKGIGRIAAPPPGASIPQPLSSPSGVGIDIANRIAGQEVLNSLIESPEMAGRYTTHREWVEAVKKDFNTFTTFLKTEGYWSAK
jgi:hypothetical protein